MNKADLRYRKTEKALTDSYIKLRTERKRPIRLTELCQEAMINKTTFYRHYGSMERLHSAVCHKMIQETLSECESIHCLLSDTGTFCHEFCSVFAKHREQISAVFYDRYECIGVIEEELLKLYLSETESPVDRARIRFVIGGASRILAGTDLEMIETAILLIKKVLG